jgi:hypothetical protein
MKQLKYSLFLLAPPIVITKAHSIAPSLDSVHHVITPVSTSHPNTNTDTEVLDHEKPPVIIEEQTQEHQYGSPPAFEEQLNKKVTVKDIKPVIINSPESMSDPTLIPVAELPLEHQQAVLSRDTDDDDTGAVNSNATAVDNTAETAATTQKETWPSLIRTASSDIDKQINSNNGSL